MRATELLGASVLRPDGGRLGEVVDVRLLQDGPILGADCALRIEGLVVGRSNPGAHLGYDRAGVRGPALLAALSRRAHRHNCYLAWADVASIDGGVVRARTDVLPPVPDIRSDR
jgi:hypothetical protein